MLDVKALHDKELAECRATFDDVDWHSASMAEADRICPKCGSNLVAQKNPKNKDHQSADVGCRACGAKSTAGDLIVHSLVEHFQYEHHVAVKDGGEEPLHHCPECGAKAYVTYDEENACAYCDYSLEGRRCGLCDETLTPSTVSADNNGFCSYCDYKMSKDD
jgi:DNA-directed RNA polymerase subunit M/transcription elongation factor TFIIS